jgi:hypothetical protein
VPVVVAAGVFFPPHDASASVAVAAPITTRGACTALNLTSFAIVASIAACQSARRDVPTAPNAAPFSRDVAAGVLVVQPPNGSTMRSAGSMHTATAVSFFVHAMLLYKEKLSCDFTC